MSGLMRRASPGLAVAGAALSTVWLFDPALHSDPEMTATSSVESPSAEEPSTETPSDESTTPDGTGSSSDDDTTEAPDAAEQEGTDASDDATATGDCEPAEELTGDAVMTRWGPVQVQMTFAEDGTVCSVTAIAYPDDDPHSSRINATAIPWLDEAALTEGVEFDTISGATYTCEAYRESMQSILDQR